MALVKKRSSSNNLIIIAIVIGVVGAIGFVLYQQFATNTGIAPVDTSDRTQGVITNFDQGILQDRRFTELKPYGRTLNVNTVIEEAGNPSPFR